MTELQATKLNKNDLSKELFDNIAFIKVAQCGAMGEPGVIKFLKSNGQWYEINYDKKMSIEEVGKYFPTLLNCEFGPFGVNAIVPIGWEYVNLGAGNYLLIEESYFEGFWVRVKDFKLYSEIYKSWEIVADKVVNECLTDIANNSCTKLKESLDGEIHILHLPDKRIKKCIN